MNEKLSEGRREGGKEKRPRRKEGRNEITRGGTEGWNEVRNEGIVNHRIK